MGTVETYMVVVVRYISLFISNRLLNDHKRHN